MKPPTLDALLGASFGLAMCQFFPTLLALLDYTSIPGPPSAGVILTVATCGVAAFVMRYSRADKPEGLAFVATAVFEAALTVYSLAQYAQTLARLIQHGGSAKSIVELVFYALANVAGLGALVGALAGVAARLKEKAKRVSSDKQTWDTTWAKPKPAARRTEPEETDYWLGAVSAISLAASLLALAVFVDIAAGFPPRHVWPLRYGTKVALCIVQLTVSPVALYGGLKANRNCIIAGMASAVLQVLLYAVLVVVNIIDTRGGFSPQLLHWAAVYGAQTMATVAVLANAYARVSPPRPPPLYKVRPLADGEA